MSSVEKIAIVASIGGIAVFVTLAVAWLYGRRHPEHALVAWVRQWGVAVAFCVTMLAVAGSLYYSQVAHFEPCTLCWWQRVYMFPLLLILGIAWWRGDVSVKKYAMPLAVISGLLAAYNSYLQQWPPVGHPCVFGGLVDCSTRYVFVWGFITIPLLSLIASVLIIMSLLVWRPTIKIPSA